MAPAPICPVTLWRLEPKCAGVGIGVFPDYSIAKDWNKAPAPEDLTNPNEENHRIYMKYYGIYRSLYENNRELFEELAQIQ